MSIFIFQVKNKCCTVKINNNSSTKSININTDNSKTNDCSNDNGINNSSSNNNNNNSSNINNMACSPWSSWCGWFTPRKLLHTNYFASQTTQYCINSIDPNIYRLSAADTPSFVTWLVLYGAHCPFFVFWEFHSVGFVFQILLLFSSSLLFCCCCCVGVRPVFIFIAYSLCPVAAAASCVVVVVLVAIYILSSMSLLSLLLLTDRCFMGCYLPSLIYFYGPGTLSYSQIWIGL